MIYIIMYITSGNSILMVALLKCKVPIAILLFNFFAKVEQNCLPRESNRVTGRERQCLLIPRDHRDGPVASVIPDLIDRQIWQISWNNLHTCAMVDGKRQVDNK